MYHIRNNYTLKYVYNDENECINDTLLEALLILLPSQAISTTLSLLTTSLI